MIGLGCNYFQELIDLIEREEIEDGLKEIAKRLEYQYINHKYLLY